MRILTTLSIVICAGIFFSSCGTNNVKWAKYTSPNGGFSVVMPENPKVTDKQETTPFGKQKVHYVTWKPATFELNKFKMVQVAFTDCPAGYMADSVHSNAVMDSSINQRKRDFTDADVLSHPIDINGYPGRAFIYDPAGENAITIVKQCFANGRRYDLTVIAKRDYPTNNELNDFFNSFTVLK